MLTEEQFNQWLAELRSGKYKQISGSLKGPNDHCFCALGVLAFPILGLFPNAENSPGEAVETAGADNMGQILPEKFMISSNQEDVWRKNDSEGYSFLEIADWLERERHGFVEPKKTETTT